MKKTIYKKTQKIRHFIVKIIAPTLYYEAVNCAVSTRPMIGAVKKRFGDKEITGVEIGAKEGRHASEILLFLKGKNIEGKNISIKKLYLIDPYEFYVDEGRPIDTTNSLSVAKKLLARFGEKVVFVLKKSSEAINNIPDKVDFVYIDGNHTYKFVKDDINNYYDKVKSGGIIGGHNFDDEPGVYKAVTEFAIRKNLKLKKEKSDWWIIKP